MLRFLCEGPHTQDRRTLAQPPAPVCARDNLWITKSPEDLLWITRTTASGPDTVEGMAGLKAIPGFEVAGPQVTYRNYTRSDYQRVLRGVYARGAALDGLDAWERRQVEFIRRARAAMEVYAPRGAVLYGSTALQVMGVSLPHALEDWDRIHILVPHGASRGRRHGIVFHQARNPLVVWRMVYAMAVLHPVEHWMQLTGATDDQMVEVGDGFLRRKDPWLTRDEMSARIDSYSDLTGIRQARRVFPLVMAGTDSLPETTVRLILVRAGLPTPLVNPEVYCPGVGIPFHIDMGYEPEKIAIEYDGADHTNRFQMQQDALKRRSLQDERWLVITVTAADLRRAPQVAASVETALVMRRAALAL